MKRCSPQPVSQVGIGAQFDQPGNHRMIAGRVAMHERGCGFRQGRLTLCVSGIGISTTPDQGVNHSNTDVLLIGSSMQGRRPESIPYSRICTKFD